MRRRRRLRRKSNRRAGHPHPRRPRRSRRRRPLHPRTHPHLHHARPRRPPRRPPRHRLARWSIVDELPSIFLVSRSHHTQYLEVGNFHLILATLRPPITQTCHSDQSKPTLFISTSLLRSCQLAKWRNPSSIYRASQQRFSLYHERKPATLLLRIIAYAGYRPYPRKNSAVDFITSP